MNVWLPRGWHVEVTETADGWKYWCVADHLEPEQSSQVYPNETLALRAARHAIRVQAYEKKVICFTEFGEHFRLPGTKIAFCGTVTRTVKMRDTKRSQKCKRCVALVREIERAMERLEETREQAQDEKTRKVSNTNQMGELC